VKTIKDYENFGNIKVDDAGAGGSVELHVHHVVKIVATRPKGTDRVLSIRIVTENVRGDRQTVDLCLFPNWTANAPDALKINRVLGYVEMVNAAAEGRA